MTRDVNNPSIRSVRRTGNKARNVTLRRIERDIIRLACDGLTDRQISVRLSISEETVRSHLATIMQKLNVKGRVELIIYAHCNRIITR